MSKHIILLPHLKVHNANALSSPFTIGFPALTGFLGFAHALQRKLNASAIECAFTGVGVVSHQANLQTYKGNSDFVHSIVGTGNPLEPKTVKGKPDGYAARPSFIEEARIHLDVSIVLEVTGLSLEQREYCIEKLRYLLNGQMKLAGGDILSHQKTQFHIISDDDNSLQKLQRQLMPGYALIERRELLSQAMNDGLDALEGLIDYLAVHNVCTVKELSPNQRGEQENSQEIQWQTKRKTAGWIVPVAIGFQGISELGTAKNQRDEHTPHRFAESVVTLGEFKMPHRLASVDSLLWRYHASADSDLYLCQQTASTVLNTAVMNDTGYESESTEEEF